MALARKSQKNFSYESNNLQDLIFSKFQDAEQDSAPGALRPRRPKTCGCCGQIGHNRATCPQRAYASSPVIERMNFVDEDDDREIDEETAGDK